MNEAKKELDALGMFKADLVSFTRYYKFMSQIVDYDSTASKSLTQYLNNPVLAAKFQRLVFDLLLAKGA